jgi:adenine-specific DNA methylase
VIEHDFDIPFVSELALHEKQIQQNYRPLIAVHKWFARRPGTLFRSLLLAEFAPGPLRDCYYRTNDLAGRVVADPFMGGGSPLMEANRLGCDVVGYDINPMAYWIVKEEIEHLDLAAYRQASDHLRATLSSQLGHLYKTRCLCCGNEHASVKYFLWVKARPCSQCGHEVRLFPGFLVAEDRRHPANVVLCRFCGELTEAVQRSAPGPCRSCAKPLDLQGVAKRGTCACPTCGQANRYPTPQCGPPSHALYALEYHCTACKSSHQGRYFKKPDVDDLARIAESANLWRASSSDLVPDDGIPEGDESTRLHRWGYRYYREMFNDRQLVGLDLSCRLIADCKDTRVRNALATNLSDLLRYQNMLCRYDTMALKSLDIFSVHGFPVGLVHCESNLLGIAGGTQGSSVGSGGWSNIVEKYMKAKAYCEAPFEVKHDGARKVSVPIPGEWIGETRGPRGARSRSVQIACGDAAKAVLSPNSLDAVLTDPPYFGNVQYAELMDFCYVWLRRLVGSSCAAFRSLSTRDAEELTANENMGRGIEHFTEGLSAVFRRFAAALKPGSPFAFTYHHNRIEAYLPVAVAILDARMRCSSSIPCPAEMGASIHISGTGSSVVDTVFVCRSTGRMPKRLLAQDPEAMTRVVREDMQRLIEGQLKPTVGDVRCVAFGHMVRMAIWELSVGWDAARPVQARLAAVDAWIKERLPESAVLSPLEDLDAASVRLGPLWAAEGEETYGGDQDALAF